MSEDKLDQILKELEGLRTRVDDLDNRTLHLVRLGPSIPDADAIKKSDEFWKDVVKRIEAENPDLKVGERLTRQDAEKNRRAIEVLKEKSEQHGAKVCTLSGKPPDPEYSELHNAPQPVDGNGQHRDYYVLCPEERAKGFIRPVRRTYIHDKCHTSTSMGLALAETYARDPKFYGATFCCNCGAHYPIAEFKWEDGEVLGT